MFPCKENFRIHSSQITSGCQSGEHETLINYSEIIRLKCKKEYAKSWEAEVKRGEEIEAGMQAVALEGEFSVPGSPTQHCVANLAFPSPLLTETSSGFPITG